MSSHTFYDLARRRRSTRIFRDETVDPEVIRRIVSAAVEAPSSCNRQLWHCTVVTDPEVKKRISRMTAAEQSYLYDAPVLLAVFYDCTLECRNPCKTPFVTAGMAIYAMLLAAEEEQVGAIYLGGIRKPAGVSAALDAPKHLTCVGVICVGHKADTPPCPPRRPLEQVISYDRCDAGPPHFPADIRPHLWTLRQLADFRDKLIWYKGIHIDARTLHADPDPRFSEKYRYLTGRAGMLCAQIDRPAVLDVLSLNGALVLQLLNTCGNHLGALYAYELTAGTLGFMDAYFSGLLQSDRLHRLVNEDRDRIRIPLPDNQIDLMTCYERLEQFHDPGPLLAEMHRVLKPGGRVLVAVSNRFYPHLYRYRRMRNREYALGRNWNRGPERKMEPREVQNAFRRAGFSIDRMSGLQPLHRKGFELLERICRRIGAHHAADALADRRTLNYVDYGPARFFCSTLAYELSKPE